MTTPLSLYYFGRFSVIAPLANLLVLPFIPLAMLIGFVNVIIGMVILPAGQIFGWISWIVLKYIIAVLQILSSWNLASVETPKISGVGIVIFYAVIVIFIFRKRKILNIEY
jgi:competence protein ComEC